MFLYLLSPYVQLKGPTPHLPTNPRKCLHQCPSTCYTTLLRRSDLGRTGKETVEEETDTIPLR